MNKIEYLLNILGEECSETDQMVHKTLRFGIDEVRAGQPLTNRERLANEINDILAMVEMLEWEGFIFPNLNNREAIEKKKANVKKYMKISVEQGTLQGVCPCYYKEEPCAKACTCHNALMSGGCRHKQCTRQYGKSN